MPAVVLVGLQWGDEGKGKITDFWAERADCIVRFQGGNNAGHTVIAGGEKYQFHLMPSGVIRGKDVVIGNGVVVNPDILIGEINMLRTVGNAPRLHISDRAHVIMPYHWLLDGAEEQVLGDEKIGTTKRGIGPCYADKIGRFGIRMGDLIDSATLYQKLQRVVQIKQAMLDAFCVSETLDADELHRTYTRFGHELQPYITDTTRLLNHLLDKEKVILFEGAQGCLLDIDFGTYPYTTSSHPVAGGATIGTGVGPRRIDKTMGVLKAYTTRVGEGPMPTELTDAVGEHLVKEGKEFGTTTGRKRRCGWLDIVAAQYACRVNGVDEIALTKLDVLDGLTPLKLCVKYSCGQKTLDNFPSSINELTQCQPLYQELPGWESTAGTTAFEDLPVAAQQYIKTVSNFLGVPISIVSTGPSREETLLVSET
jgi:adenylosuccinate synthase